jgi:hypothetical protein
LKRNILVLNIYKPNNIITKYVKQNKAEVKEDIDKSIIVIEFEG